MGTANHQQYAAWKLHGTHIRAAALSLHCWPSQAQGALPNATARVRNSTAKHSSNVTAAVLGNLPSERTARAPGVKTPQPHPPCMNEPRGNPASSDQSKENSIDNQFKSQCPLALAPQRPRTLLHHPVPKPQPMCMHGLLAWTASAVFSSTVCYPTDSTTYGIKGCCYPPLHPFLPVSRDVASRLYVTSCRPSSRPQLPPPAPPPPPPSCPCSTT